MRHLEDLELHSELFSGIGFAGAARWCPNLRKLDLSCPITDEGLEALQGLPIEELKIWNTSALTPRAFARLGELFPNLKRFSVHRITDAHLQALRSDSLESLSIGASDITGVGLNGIAGRLPALTTLSLSGCEQVSDPELVDLSALHLKSLEIIGTAITAAGLGNLGRLFPFLEYLSLESNDDLTDEGLHVLQIRTLRRLNLSSCSQISGWGLGDIRGRLPILERLDLSFCENVTDEALQGLIAPSLLSLTIRSCRYITDYALVEIKERMPQLMQFIYSNKNLTNRGLFHLCGLPLQEVDLYGCVKITDLGIAYLISPTLRILHLDYCIGLTDAVFEYLNQCPNLRFVDLKGRWITDERMIDFQRRRGLFIPGQTFKISFL